MATDVETTDTRVRVTTNVGDSFAGRVCVIARPSGCWRT
jgi:hypothetical protein